MPGPTADALFEMTEGGLGGGVGRGREGDAWRLLRGEEEGAGEGVGVAAASWSSETGGREGRGRHNKERKEKEDEQGRHGSRLCVLCCGLGRGVGNETLLLGMHRSARSSPLLSSTWRNEEDTTRRALRRITHTGTGSCGNSLPTQLGFCARRVQGRRVESTTRTSCLALARLSFCADSLFFPPGPLEGWSKEREGRPCGSSV